MLKPIVFAAAMALVAMMSPASAQTAIKVFAADSLQPAMADLASEFQKATGGQFKIEPVLGPTAALRERIEKGEAAHVFAAADIGEAKKLADAGKTRGPAVPFAKPKSGGAPLGFVVMKDAPPAAGELAGFLRFGAGRSVLEKHGFGTP
ncbi:MAG: substrate-binding domain-containing protein [Hyphomicrobiaceae bacterium]|nr:substrate-binding domain-containing protein [Hyphomicrobiaceae bacterium]